MRRSPAVLLDVDGTLVDSNYAHVHAWQRAFVDLDVNVEAWRIHRSIGMDGSRLLGELAPEGTRDEAKALHDRYYRELAPLLRPLPGARELIDEIAARGLQAVLASSAQPDEMAILRDVLDRDDVFSATTSSGDVDEAKPRPDIVEVAMERAGVESERAVFVGDTVWDVRAAGRAGVRCIGMLSGGVSRGELEAEGADTVWDNPFDLLKHLADSPIGELISGA